MKLSQIIDRIGDADITVQWMHEAAVHATTNKKGESRITVLTSNMNTNDVFGLTQGQIPKRIGLIIWMPAAKYEEALNHFRDVEKVETEKVS